MTEYSSIPKAFITTHAFQRGHFKLRGGQHTDTFLQCAYIVKNPKQTAIICNELATLCKESNAQLVIGPALGGMIFGYEVSRILNLPFLYTERKDKAMTMRRGFTIEPGTRVLIVEDVVTTGGSVREIIQIVRALGGQVVMIAALADRSNGKIDFGIPFVYLMSYKVNKWKEEICPLCAKGILLNKPLPPSI